MGMVGCGGGDEAPTPLRIESAKSTTPPDQYLDEEPLIALDLLDARITKDEQDQVIRVNLGRSPVTDAGLVHLKSLTEMQQLWLDTNYQVTDAGLVHLKGMTNLTYLRLNKTQVTDAGVAELQQALPNCAIIK